MEHSAVDQSTVDTTALPFVQQASASQNDLIQETVVSNEANGTCLDCKKEKSEFFN